MEVDSSAGSSTLGRAGAAPSGAPPVSTRDHTASRGGAGRVWSRIALTLLLGLLSIDAAARQEQTIGSISAISENQCEDMKLRHVLNPGAPVDCNRLKLVKFSYIDFDGRPRDDGEIVVLDAVAKHVLAIFNDLRKVGFRIAKAKLMNEYDGNDDASMADNNTSAFNVRKIVGGSSISLHAYGLAIDINPVQNPFLKRRGTALDFSPPGGVENANRLNERPGKPTRQGMAETAVDIFADHGFLIWGGYWDDPIDYQHFQVSRKLAEKLAELSPDEARRAFNRHVQRYRNCRRAAPRGAEARAKCIMATDGNNN